MIWQMIVGKIILLHGISINELIELNQRQKPFSQNKNSFRHVLLCSSLKSNENYIPHLNI